MRRLVLACLLALPALPARPDGDRAIARLIERFRDGPPAERMAAAYRLRRLGRRAWHFVAPCLADPDPDVRRRARRLWRQMLEADDGWWGVPAPGSRFDPESKLPLRVIDRASRAELVLVSPGRFTMGSNVGPPWEAPAHRVTIGKAFYLGRYELTQAEYRRGLPEAYYFSSESRGRYPAAGLSFRAIARFLKRTGLRLPTEAEWEYVAQAGYDPHRIGSVAWHRANSGGSSHRVGTREPNPFGVYDLLGNVAEWVADPFGPYDGDDRRTRGRKGRVVRGGSVTRPPGDCRPTYRRALPADFRSEAIGFRVARSP